MKIVNGVKYLEEGEIIAPPKRRNKWNEYVRSNYYGKWSKHSDQSRNHGTI